MTVSYSGQVPNGSSFGVFWKILWKWRGSVYKLVWRELVAYLAIYYLIDLTYKFVLNTEQKIIFDHIRQYFSSHNESIPMSFVLGFYVSLVVKRWWEQYRMLPWPDTLALFISAAIPGNLEINRLMRRNIMRYMVLAYVITLQRISLRVKKRFPSWQHLVDAGLMLESEKKIFEIMDGKSPMSKYWMPLVWATNIINRARKDGHISSDHIVQTLLIELSDIRRRLGGLISYDTVCVPLVYTQVVTLVLYSYFMAALLGRQYDPETNKELVFPLFTVLQFVFYVGWLKVAEVLINPFGEDDDDIELNWLIDRHIKASYMIVDEMHDEFPDLCKDQYWEEVVPKDLPYTVASEHYRRSEPKGSAEKYKIKAEDAVYANIMTKRSIQDPDAYADYESVDTPMVERRKNWFSRQITRMGSARSASTAYSSGVVFGRGRNNSVYSSPEAGLPPGSQNHHNPSAAKMTIYDKLIGRKSLRNQRLMKQNSRTEQRVNGSIAKPKSRPRIPTPDVTKDTVNEKQTNLTKAEKLQNTANSTSVASGVALVSQHLANNPSVYPTNSTTLSSSTSNNPNEVPMVGLLLSPIKEMESLSVNSTLQAGHPATKALAKAVMPATLKSAGLNGSGTALATLTLTSEANSTQQPVTLMLPVTTTAENSNVFVLSTTAPSLPTSPIPTLEKRVEDYPDDQILVEETPPTPVTTTAVSPLDQNLKTMITTFPVKKSNSFSDMRKFNDSHVVCDAPDGGTEEKISIESPELPLHSISEPASKTSTLTKREVYV